MFMERSIKIYGVSHRLGVYDCSQKLISRSHGIESERQISPQNANNQDRKAKQVRAKYQKAIISSQFLMWVTNFPRSGYLLTNSPKTG